jgi:5-methylcytosine-specific restriction endonuclease McrA
MKSERLRLPISAVLALAARDGYRCHICGLGFMVDDPWEIDHDVPLARGGTNHERNLRLTHATCNRGKASI